ncbi:MAG: hypothetical protein J3Q66DRAFT_430903 [Benniella sp.]|nr:MAG: hypothetical protein J3Q66DRAFT_430903 [Benniella sp.]
MLSKLPRQQMHAITLLSVEEALSPRSQDLPKHHLPQPQCTSSSFAWSTSWTGIRAKTTLSLDLSNSQLNDGGAIILAQELFSTNICHLDLSRNEKLSDTTAARVIRAIGPRLTSLEMAQTGFGDLAAAALAKTMDVYSPAPEVRRVEAREKTHSRGHLVYLDIEDSHCTVQGFKSLAKVKSHLHFVYLNLSGSKGLQDKECAQILERVASSVMVTLRLAWTGFGGQSAKVLARVFMGHAARDDWDHANLRNWIFKHVRSDRMDCERCARLLRANRQPLHDHILQQLVATLVIKNAALRSAATQFKGNTLDVNGTRMKENQTTAFPDQARIQYQDPTRPRKVGQPLSTYRLKTTLPMPLGFFTNLQQLDLKSTQVRDDTAWLLSQALVQMWTMIHSLMILEPIAMSVQGVCWILEALRENTSVQEFGIGKSNITRPSDLEDFGSALAGPTSGYDR